MMVEADFVKGKPYEKVVLWENSDTSAVFSAQSVTLEDSISNYDEIGIYYKVSRSDNDSVAIPVFMNVGDFKKTSSTGDKFTFGNTIVIGSSGYGRVAYYVSDTSIQITTCYKFNASASSDYNAIPVKIIGIKKGIGRVVEPIEISLQFGYTAYAQTVVLYDSLYQLGYRHFKITATSGTITKIRYNDNGTYTIMSADTEYELTPTFRSFSLEGGSSAYGNATIRFY